MYSIEDIEDAIIQVLKTSLGNMCPTIEPYHGEIDDIVSRAGQLIAPLPAIYIIYNSSNFEEIANRSYDENMIFSIIVIAKDLRGNNKLRAAIYPIIEIIKDTLIDNDLNLDIQPMHPVRIEAVAITKVISIYTFDVQTSFSYNN